MRKPNLLFTITVVSLVFFSCSNSIEDQVVKESLETYEMAKQSGDKTQIAVEAGGVAEAYKMAGDQANYQKWLKIAEEAEKNMQKEVNDDLGL